MVMSTQEDTIKTINRTPKKGLRRNNSLILILQSFLNVSGSLYKVKKSWRIKSEERD